MKKIFLFAVLCACTLSIFAYDFSVNDICYKFLGGDSVEVTYKADSYYGPRDLYIGSIIILETVTYNNVTYRVTAIDDHAFSASDSLTNVTIPNSVTKIGSRAFAYCSSLTSITIPNSVTTIGDIAFAGCSNLTDVIIGNGVTSIGDRAFDECYSVQYNIHDNAKYLGNIENPYNALISAVDRTITSCVIPKKIKAIADGAFDGCRSLTEITIPESISTIGSGTFSGCGSLTEITIPNSVTTIGDGAFEGCSSLAAITCLAVTPPTIKYGSFYEVDKTIPLYVPAESIEAYKAAEYWKEFTNIQGILGSTAGLETLYDNVSIETRKVFENGVIYIIRNGEKYTIDGCRAL